MTARKKTTIVLALILLVQLILFRDYIAPFYWGQIKVSGLACTCPDETVVNGELYLRAITPDSLKQFDLDYSEIYVTERPSSDFDPMGVDFYIIKGIVIGKERVSAYDPWNPKVKVEEWREINFLKDWAIKALLIVQLILFPFILKLIPGNKKI